MTLIKETDYGTPQSKSENMVTLTIDGKSVTVPEGTSIMRAAITGHMVLSTLHTNDVVTTPIRLIDMGVPRYMVAL